MRSCKVLGFLAAISISWTASAQPPPAKPKPARKPAAAAKPVKPVEKAAEPAPPELPPAAPTDVKIRTTYTSGAQVSENTTYFKGLRQRFEFPGITLINQCDLKRSLQLHDATKHFKVVSTEAAVADHAPEAPDLAGSAAAAAPAPTKGGVLAETITLTDTGDRKQMFGLEARHIKTVVVRKPGANACDPRTITIETDGWYADLPEHVTCLSSPAQTPPPPPAAQQACTDRVDTQQVGTAKLGFALSTDVITTTEEGKEKDLATMAMEVTDLKVTSLEPALFDVPPGYTEVQNYQELLPALSSGGSLADAVFGSLSDGTSTVAPKKPGVIRIGIVDPTNKSGRTMSTQMLRSGLMGSLARKPFEALPVTGGTPADLDRDAREKACDFILISEIAELKTSKPGKVGGMLKKVSGDANAQNEIHDARVEYKLYAVGDQARPKMTASTKASSGGGFGVGSALRFAAFAGSMYMTMGMGSGMMMNMMGPGASMGGIGGLGSVMNPGMSAAMSMMSAGGGMTMPGMSGMPGMGDDRATQTVQDALSKAGKQVADELKTGKLSANGDKK
jgi:hypothetical protein